MDKVRKKMKLKKRLAELIQSREDNEQVLLSSCHGELMKNEANERLGSIAREIRRVKYALRALKK